MEEFLIPVCTPEYLRAHGIGSAGDLASCTLLHDAHASMGPEDAEWRYWLDRAGAHDVDSRKGQFFTLANLSLEAALAHQGVAMGRVSLIRELLEAGQLVAPLPQQVKSPLRYCIVYPKELESRPAIAAMIGWLREQVPRP